MTFQSTIVTKRAALATAIVAALIALPSTFVSAAEASSSVDARGNIVIGARAVRPPSCAARTRADRDFHPDYTGALSVGQMSAAWQAEIDRLFPQPVTGGG